MGLDDERGHRAVVPDLVASQVPSGLSVCDRALSGYDGVCRSDRADLRTK